jgi:hypothetical protein
MFFALRKCQGTLSKRKVPQVHVHREQGLGACVIRLYSLCVEGGPYEGIPKSRLWTHVTKWACLADGDKCR